MMETQTLCSLWVLLTTLCVTFGADITQWKKHSKSLPSPSTLSTGSDDLHGAAAANSPKLLDDDLPHTPDSYPASTEDGFPPLPDGFAPEWQGKLQPNEGRYPPERHAGFVPMLENLPPEWQDHFQPFQDHLPPKHLSDFLPLPDDHRPRWPKSFPPISGNHPPEKLYDYFHASLDGYLPEPPYDFPPHMDRHPPEVPYDLLPHPGRHPPESPYGFPPHGSRHPPELPYNFLHYPDRYPHEPPYDSPPHSDDYPLKQPYDFPPHPGRHLPQPQFDFSPHPDDYPPKPFYDLPPHLDGYPPNLLDNDFPPYQGSHPPTWPDRLPPFLHNRRGLLSVPESEDEQSNSQPSLPDSVPSVDNRQAVTSPLPPLSERKNNPEESSGQKNPEENSRPQSAPSGFEALMRRTLRREGRKHSRLRELHKLLLPQPFPQNAHKTQKPFPKTPSQREPYSSKGNVSNVNHSKEVNKPEKPSNPPETDESRKVAQRDDFDKSALGVTDSVEMAESSQQGKVNQGSRHNSKPPSPDIQQKNSIRKRKPEGSVKEETALGDEHLQPFLDRKKAASFLSRQPPPSQWKRWLKKLFRNDQKTRDQYDDDFSLHHDSHKIGDDDDDHEAADHLGTFFPHHNSHNIDDDDDHSDIRQRASDQAEQDSREEIYHDQKTSAESDKLEDNSDKESDSDEGDSAVDDSSRRATQHKNRGLSKRSNNRKKNGKKINLRKPQVEEWCHRRQQRLRRLQRRLQQRQHLQNRRQKARVPKNLLPAKHRRRILPKDVLSSAEWLNPQREVVPNRNKHAGKRPLPSKWMPHKRSRPFRQRFQQRRRIPQAPRFPHTRVSPSRRRFVPIKHSWRKPINRGRRRKAKRPSRRRSALCGRHRGKAPPSRKPWWAKFISNKKKRVLKKDCDDVTSSPVVVKNTIKQNSSFTLNTTQSQLSKSQYSTSTEPMVPQRGGLTTEAHDLNTPAKEKVSLPKTSTSIVDKFVINTTTSPVLPEKDEGEGEGRGGVVPVRTVYLGAVEGSRIEAARLDVLRSESNSSARSNSTPVFVGLHYKRQDQPHHSSAAGALERTKRNADDDQDDNGSDDNDDIDDDVNDDEDADDDDLHFQRRNRRRRIQRRRQGRKRNRMNWRNRQRRLNNDSDDNNDIDDISVSSENRQLVRRRGNFRQLRREGINADVDDDGNDDDNRDNDNDQDQNNDDADSREQIRMHYRRREPIAIEVTVNEDDNNEDNNDHNRIMGFVHLGSNSRRNRQRDDSSNRRRQHIRRNRRRRQRQRHRNRQRGRQPPRRRLTSDDDADSENIRSAHDVSRESEPQTPLSQIQTVRGGNGQVGQEDAEAYIPSPFINHRTAYDFLSTQARSRSRGQRRGGVNEQQAEQWQFNHRMSESMCEVFDKHFVPTSLGGRCV